MYDVVVAQSRSPRDGVFIEKIGTYNPLTNPASIQIKEDKALGWLMKGAQPTETVRSMLSYKGVMYRKHLQVGVLKGSITQEVADQRFEEWKKLKEGKIGDKIEKIARDKEAAKSQKAADETKVNEKRAAALRKKLEARIKAEEAAAHKVAEEAAPAPAPVAETHVAPVESPAPAAESHAAPAESPAPAAESPAAPAESPAPAAETQASPEPVAQAPEASTETSPAPEAAPEASTESSPAPEAAPEAPAQE